MGSWADANAWVHGRRYIIEARGVGMRVLNGVLNEGFEYMMSLIGAVCVRA